MGDSAKHRILLVNDDGIDAPGMQILERLASELSDDVWVVAPDDNRSGASHSISFNSYMRVKPAGHQRYAITGTPIECALLAIHELIPGRKPTLCLSGINRGPNLAEDSSYSGTIAGAREAAQLGIPSIAISQVFAHGENRFTVGQERKIHWETSEQWGLPVLRRLLECEWQPNAFLNVNFPGVPPEQVRGMKITTHGQRPPGCYIPERRVDEQGEACYQVLLAYREGDKHPDSDLQAIQDNYVSVTPMQLDLTHRRFRDALLSSFPEASVSSR